jgi:hypothetical protein
LLALLLALLIALLAIARAIDLRAAAVAGVRVVAEIAVLAVEIAFVRIICFARLRRSMLAARVRGATVLRIWIVRIELTATATAAATATPTSTTASSTATIARLAFLLGRDLTAVLLVG